MFCFSIVMWPAMNTCYCRYITAVEHMCCVWWERRLVKQFTVHFKCVEWNHKIETLRFWHNSLSFKLPTRFNISLTDIIIFSDYISLSLWGFCCRPWLIKYKLISSMNTEITARHRACVTWFLKDVGRRNFFTVVTALQIASVWKLNYWTIENNQWLYSS